VLENFIIITILYFSFSN